MFNYYYSKHCLIDKNGSWGEKENFNVCNQEIFFTPPLAITQCQIVITHNFEWMYPWLKTG